MARLSWVFALIAPVLVAQQLPAQEALLVASQNKVSVHAVGGLTKSKAAQAFVITHGMGGAAERFMELGRAIKKHQPDANVFVVDWTPGATNPKGGITTPWAVAPNIDPTGEVLATILFKLHAEGDFDPAQATFLGESFGNYVNNRAAATLFTKGLSKPGLALAFNPASELGGYEPPQMSKAFRKSAGFHSPSMFDTQRKIADFTLKLQTPTKNAFEQHTFGIPWLMRQVAAGQTSWLGLEAVSADGTVGVDGTFTVLAALTSSM